jgi:16S rRNA pseudouridine516 synthase
MVTTDGPERLQKLIAATGLCSRRRAEELLRAGLVQVNGVRAALGDKASPLRDRIVVAGRPLAPTPEPLVMLMNKPRGVLCSCRDPQGRRTVLDLLPSGAGEVAPGHQSRRPTHPARGA